MKPQDGVVPWTILFRKGFGFLRDRIQIILFDNIIFMGM